MKVTVDADTILLLITKYLEGEHAFRPRSGRALIPMERDGCEMVATFKGFEFEVTPLNEGEDGGEDSTPEALDT